EAAISRLPRRSLFVGHRGRSDLWQPVSLADERQWRGQRLTATLRITKWKRSGELDRGSAVAWQRDGRQPRSRRRRDAERLGTDLLVESGRSCRREARFGW